MIGDGAVYVLEGRHISYSGLSEDREEGVLSMFNVLLHVLGAGHTFDLAKRQPRVPDTGNEG